MRWRCHAGCSTCLTGPPLRLLPSCRWCDDDDDDGCAPSDAPPAAVEGGGVGACRPVGRTSAAHAEGRAGALAGLGDLELFREPGADRRVWYRVATLRLVEMLEEGSMVLGSPAAVVAAAAADAAP